MVDTNIAHIVETFAPREDARKQLHAKVEEVIRLMMNDVQDVKDVSDVDEWDSVDVGDIDERDMDNMDEWSDVDEWGKGLNDKVNGKAKVLVSGFSACFGGELDDKVNKTDRIMYQFMDRNVKMEKGFTMLEYKEYFELVNRVNEMNGVSEKNGKAKVNLVELINLYLYMKMRIACFQNVEKMRVKMKMEKGIGRENGREIGMRDSVAKMSKVMKVGNKTVSRYVGVLMELGMIKGKSGKWGSVYWLG
jgi:hypothetical protein